MAQNPLISLLLAGALVFAGCTTLWQTEAHPVGDRSKIDTHAPFLKVHTVDGGVYVLERWRIDDTARTVAGRGLHFDAARDPIGAKEREHHVAYADVVLLETNVPEQVFMHTAQLVVMGVFAAGSLAMTAVCIASPKTCFGSCPTIYAAGPDGYSLRAEGFSGSVAKLLESTDVDRLGEVNAVDGRVDLLLKNEALETHAVRSMDLLAVPRNAGEQIVRVGAEFYAAQKRLPLRDCRGRTGACATQLRERDGAELLSLTSEADLAERETIEIEMGALPARSALIVTARNSLVNTFLFYELLARMGSTAGRWVAALERGDPLPKKLHDELLTRLGGIQISARGGTGPWQEVGTFNEVGPIAADSHGVILPELSGNVQLRLEMARGYWRIDEVSAVALGPKRTPVRVKPDDLHSLTTPDEAPAPGALRRLLDGDQYLITYPGQSYRVGYQPPPAHALFVEARGYYVEWTRDVWRKEENALATAHALVDPGGFLRDVAPAFKAIEPAAERAFWQSRVPAP